MIYHGYAHGGDGWHVFAWVLFVLLLALAAGLAVALASRLGVGRGSPAAPAAAPAPPAEDPQALVRLRYARGEIDRETFLQLTQDLGGPPARG